MPVPFIGCTSQVSIYQLTVSEEMAPWSVDYSYDKPIARRLVEEAGIDRDAFGVKKTRCRRDPGQQQVKCRADGRDVQRVSAVY